VKVEAPVWLYEPSPAIQLRPSARPVPRSRLAKVSVIRRDRRTFSGAPRQHLGRPTCLLCSARTPPSRRYETRPRIWRRFWVSAMHPAFLLSA